VVKMALADKISGMTAAAQHRERAARGRAIAVWARTIRIPMVEAMMAFTCNDTMVGYTFVPEDEYKDPGAKEPKP